MGNIVYHYCKIAVALSVLKNQEIWMTSIRNLNDSNESVGVYKLFFNQLEKYDKDGKLASMLEFARQPGAIELYENPLGAYPEYVACFCENPDSVSQWIAYAEQGHGFAIGFDEDAFTQLDKADGIDYRAISYVSENEFDSCVPPIYDYLMENYSDNTVHLMDMAMAKIKEQYCLGRDHKTFHYASECEKRVIYNYPVPVSGMPAGWHVKDLNVYAKKTMINTYVPLGFPKEAIKAVVTGPKYQHNGYELEIALKALGYDTSTVEIRKSTSGYR